MIQKQNKKSRMKSFKYVQLLIRELCSKLFYDDMSMSDFAGRMSCVYSWIVCEHTLGRISDEYLQQARDYAWIVARNLAEGKKGDDHNAD